MNAYLPDPENHSVQEAQIARHFQSPFDQSALDRARSAAEADLKDALLRHLDTIRDAPEAERWPAADRPSEQALADARSFIQQLPPCAICTPNIGVADDGKVNFLWEGDGIYIDLGFYGAGTFSYFARDGAGRKFYGDELPASSVLPDDLLNLIRWEIK